MGMFHSYVELLEGTSRFVQLSKPSNFHMAGKANS